MNPRIFHLLPIILPHTNEMGLRLLFAAVRDSQKVAWGWASRKRLGLTCSQASVLASTVAW